MYIPFMEYRIDGCKFYFMFDLVYMYIPSRNIGSKNVKFYLCRGSNLARRGTFLGPEAQRNKEQDGCDN